MIAEPDPSGSPVKPSRGERVIALFLFGLVAFNPPLMRVFGVPEFVFGVPLLFAYLFLCWGLLIGLLAWQVECDRAMNDGRRDQG